MKVVVVIPAYNEEKNIAKVLVLTRGYADRVIVCDDGSTDLTAEIAGSLGAEVIRHSGNKGYGAALATLFARAKLENADIMVTVDGDGQHDPAEIPRVIDPLIKGEADVAIGSRFLSAGARIPGYRKAGIRAITRLSSEMAYDGITDAQSGFRAYNKRALEAIVPSEMGMGASTEILSKARDFGLKIVEVPIVIAYNGDSSTLNPIIHGLDVVLSTVKHLSIRHPLMFYGLPGFLLLLASAGFWYLTLSVFVGRGTVLMNVVLLAIASTILGSMFMVVGILVWVLISVVRGK